MNKIHNEIWLFDVLYPETIEKINNEGYSVRQAINKIDISRLIKSEITEKPVIIILDIEILGAQCWSMVHEITTHPVLKDVPLVVHTILDLEQLQIRALNYGADLFLSKHLADDVFIAQINSVLRRKKNRTSEKEENILDKLSKRELEILQFLAKGYTNKQIAEQAFITTLTVANHLKRIFKKINVKNRSQAALFALKNDLSGLLL